MYQFKISREFITNPIVVLVEKGYLGVEEVWSRVTLNNCITNLSYILLKINKKF